MKDYQIKVVQSKPWGWRRVAKNVCRFGWELNEAEKQTTTNVEHYYDSDGRLKEKKTSNSTVIMSFTRYPAKFENLLKVAPIEAIYNLCFLVRKIAGYVFPVLAGLSIICALAQLEAFLGIVSKPAIISGVAWVALIVAEDVLSRVGENILFNKGDQ